jgi:hypothetical protein
MPWGFVGLGPKAMARLHLKDRFFVLASSTSYYDSTPKNSYVTVHELGAQYNWEINQGLRCTGRDKNKHRGLECEFYYYY